MAMNGCDEIEKICSLFNGFSRIAGHYRNLEPKNDRKFQFANGIFASEKNMNPFIKDEWIHIFLFMNPVI